MEPTAAAETPTLAATFQQGLESVVNIMGSAMFFKIGGLPFIVLWLVVAAVFFTVYLRGVNLRLFRHAIDIARGKFDNDKETGEVSPLQALLSAIAGTVGLGSIAGISVAVVVGGPGAVFWVVVGGCLGMASKFAEVTLSMLYRQVGTGGKVFGGGFHYLEHGLADIGLQKLGKILAIIFAVFCLGGAVGGGAMFQSNQAVNMLTGHFAALSESAPILALGITALVGLVLLGSIKRVAKVAQFISPLKGILYLICALIILGVNAAALPTAFGLIFSEAFTGQAAMGGFIGMVGIALQRASFANEAGLGSAPIAHAAAKTEEPVREGTIALLEPFFAAMIGLLTGLIVTVTNAYVGADANQGVLIAAKAYASVGDWFVAMLVVNVLVFAYSTMIGWSYYGEIAWSYLFGTRGIRLYQALFCSTIFIGGVVKFGVVMDLADMFTLGMALPNILALYLLRKKIRSAMDAYIAKYTKP